jgi:hypothetical protein
VCYPKRANTINPSIAAPASSLVYQSKAGDRLMDSKDMQLTRCRQRRQPRFPVHQSLSWNKGLMT